MSDFNITLFEACEFLNRSKKSISRYIRRGLLHPKKVKSQQGTLEYRFSKADIEAFKAQEALNAEEARPDRTDQTDQTGQERQDTLKRENRFNKGENNQRRQDRTDQTGQGRQDKTGQDSEIITLLKETTGLLKEQLVKKDEQIKDLGEKIDQLIERDRETNIILKGLHDRVFLLEGAKMSQNRQNEAENEPEAIKTTLEPQNTEKEPTPLNRGKKEAIKTETKEKPKKRGFFSRLFSSKGDTP